MFKSMAWTTSAENNLDPVNNEENSKRFLNKKDAADTSWTPLQNVDKPFIHQSDVKFLYHAAASFWFSLSTPHPPFFGTQNSPATTVEEKGLI